MKAILFPIRIPLSHEKEPDLHPEVQIPRMRLAHHELTLRSSLGDEEDTYLTSRVFTLCSARHDVIRSMSKRAGIQGSWASLFSS